MSFAVRLLAIWSICLTSVFAQEDYAFTMEGDYPVTSQSFIPINVDFTLRWNEEGNRIRGVYTDDYFGTAVPVTGTTSVYGRSMEAILPEPVQGVKTLNFITPQVGLHNGDVTLTLTTKNPAGVPVNQLSEQADMSSRVLNPVADEEGADCVVGFGVLSGFCGQYAGTVTEVYDPQNRCGILVPGVTKLEVGEDKELRLFFQTENNVVRDAPFHYIGRLSISPMDPNVDVTNRICSRIPNVNFTNPDGCKTVNLFGAFQEIGDTPNFTGSYTIKDEQTKLECRYNMTLYRDVEY